MVEGEISKGMNVDRWRKGPRLIPGHSNAKSLRGSRGLRNRYTYIC